MLIYINDELGGALYPLEESGGIYTQDNHLIRFVNRSAKSAVRREESPEAAAARVKDIAEAYVNGVKVYVAGDDIGHWKKEEEKEEHEVKPEPKRKPGPKPKAE